MGDIKTKTVTMSSRNHVAPSHDVENGVGEKGKKALPSVMKKIITEQDIEKSQKFDAFYKTLGSKCKQEEKRIDFVLVHKCENQEELEDKEDKEEEARKNELREMFVMAMKEEGILIQKVTIDDKIYTKLHCPFKRMCEEAEIVSLEMPMKGVESENQAANNNFFSKWMHKTFVTDNEVDLVSAPFRMERMHIYHNNDDPTNFFRPSIRALLVDHILTNIDLRTFEGRTFRRAGKEGLFKDHSVRNCCGLLKEEDDTLGDLQKVGLDYMIIEGVYDDKFILHEESGYDPKDKEQQKNPPDISQLADDPRYALQLTWTRFFKFQPLWKIRNYFGEKIGFYFAWLGTLITSLWMPMLFGLVVFIYGLVVSFTGTSTTSSKSTSNSTFSDLFSDVKGSFDNDATPFFAMFICVWGTLFLEIWKRNQATLAYQWDVEQFEENEPDRPEFYGTKETVDPVTNQRDWYYPFARRAWKMCISSFTLLFMICVVLISLMAVIVYRVIITIDYCPDLPSSECLFLSTILSSILNAISIIILGKIYDIVARKLTDWENHRTDTAYNDALIIKLFGFQFVNTYSSCFYIAFVRGRLGDSGILNKGEKYNDNCEGSCMSQLSFQVMILMITKPISKFCIDIILPWVLKIVKDKCACCACLPCLKNFFKKSDKPDEEKTLLEIEMEKPSIGNFTLSEYTEKVILYGLMMLFAASFPLAPLLALFFSMIDLRIDARRMLWMYQRPMAIIAEDIGTWYVILDLLNYCGVIVNAFLIAFTSAWGEKYDTTGKLWLVIGFEHIVFLLKFLVAYLIPDIPPAVKLALRKKRHQLKLMLDKDRKNQIGNSTFSNSRKDQEKARLESEFITREDTRATSPWRRIKKQRQSFDNNEEDEVRRLKKKKKSIVNKDAIDERQDDSSISEIDLQ